jgi:hypothetical protein
MKSLLLLVVILVCFAAAFEAIWISSMLMFRLKGVLPIEDKLFWNDLGLGRFYHGTSSAFHC